LKLTILRYWSIEQKKIFLAIPHLSRLMKPAVEENLMLFTIGLLMELVLSRQQALPS
jgi:hypothetical protein